MSGWTMAVLIIVGILVSIVLVGFSILIMPYLKGHLWPGTADDVTVLATSAYTITSLFTVFIVLAAAWYTARAAEQAQRAATAAEQAIDATKQAAKASILSQLMSEYGSQEIGAAMRGLYLWGDEYSSVRPDGTRDNIDRFSSRDDDLERRYITLLQEYTEREGLTDNSPEKRVRRLTIEKIGDWRRLTYRYFHKVRVFCQAGLVQPERLDDLFRPVGANFVVRVLEPMLKAHAQVVTEIGEGYDKATIDYYRRLASTPVNKIRSEVKNSPQV